MSPRIEALEPRMLLSGNGLDDDPATTLGLLIVPAGAPSLEVGPMPLPEATFDDNDDQNQTGDDFPGEAAGEASGFTILGANPFDTFTYETEPNGLPILHSDLSAPAAIYIDFDGDTTRGDYGPYDIDGNPSTFNATERANIVECWRQASAYFAMFNVDVTTNKAVVTSGNPLQKPTAWMVMTPDINIGVSSVGVFPNTTSKSYGNGGYTTSRITIIPHEVGHNFGLRHTSEYNTLGVRTQDYAGQLDPLHGPLMGYDYAGIVRKWTMWHRGVNSSGDPDPQTIQDDITVIANKLMQHIGGDGYRPDDFGGTAGSIANATPLYVNGASQAIRGIIERMTDVDTFSFVSTGGRYAISATRDAPSGLDVKLAIYNSSGVLIASEDGDPRAMPYTMVYDQYVTMDLAAGTYYATIESHGNYGDLGQYLLRVEPLPSGWSADDVGLTAVPGSSSHASGTFTVAGSGANISGTADAYHYMHQTLKGDGSITVRVASLTNTNSAAKAGVMIRESLDVNSRMVNVYLRSGTGVYSDYRGSTGGSVASNGSNTSSSIKAPYWVRLTRSGNSFTTAYSSNGTSWTTLSTRTVTMGETVYIGVMTCSASTYRLNTATYTNVSLAGTLNPQPTLNALAAPAGVAVTGKTSNSVSLSWNAVGGATGYRIEQSSDGVNYAQVGTTAAGALAYTATGLADFNRYYYRVRAIDASGVSTPSAVVHDITRAGAVSELRIISYTRNILVLDWKDASGETGYRIERSPNGTSNWTTVGTVGKNVAIYSNTGLSTATTYYYRVVTLDAAGDSATSAVIAGCTRLNTPANFRVTEVAHNGISLAWSSVGGATGYRIERSTDGGSTFVVHASGVSGTTFTDTSIVPGRLYYYRVVGTNSLTESIAPTSVLLAISLPEPWATQDIGAVGAAGLTSFGSGSVVVSGSGEDIGGTSDEFRFVYQPFPENGQIVARVLSIQNTDPWAKAGVMIRESLDANSRYAFTMVTPSNGTVFQSRATTGGSAVTNASGPSANSWLRLTRTGDTFLSEMSTNGTSWTTLGSTTIGMGGTVYVGLAVTSHVDATLCTATFSDISVVAPPA
ncbi:MAG: DUF1349 domain-containing protein, partial [Pirellulaceae bacterium]|nr:DUF1349 domain-containing protein [Pirellulaceae bacterium]